MFYFTRNHVSENINKDSKVITIRSINPVLYLHVKTTVKTKTRFSRPHVGPVKISVS